MLVCRNSFKLSTLVPANLIRKFLRNVHQYDFKRPVKYPKRDYLKQEYNSRKALEFSKANFIAENSKRKDYYSILGVRRDATFHDIKRAYYVLAKKFHPDATQETEVSIGAKKFQEISEAYHVLSDENKRMEYDLYGSVKDVGSYLRSLTARNTKPIISNLKLVMKEQLTESCKYDCSPAVYIPEEIDVTLTFLQAVQGASKYVNVKTMSLCKKCGGILGKQRKPLEICKVCNGTGRNITTVRNYLVKGTCKACKGTRYSSTHECSACNNSGYIANQTKLLVRIPPGVNSGDVLKIPHPDGQQSVNVRVKVMKSKHFIRNGNDVLTEKYLTISEAILGGIFKIRGIYGELEVKLPEGIESHTKITLPGKGIKSKTGIGDHIVFFKIKIPKKLTLKQKEILSVLSKIE